MIFFYRWGEPVVFGVNPHTGEKSKPGTWRPFVKTDDPACESEPWKSQLAFATCPKGHECCISAGVHTVSDDGTMHPSYVCPVEGCGFHDYVRLIGWPR